MLVTQFAVLLQRLVDDSSSSGGTSGFSRTAAVGSLVQNSRRRCRLTFPAERQGAGGHFVERRRTKTSRCAHPVPSPAPAPATCRRRCPSVAPGTGQVLFVHRDVWSRRGRATWLAIAAWRDLGQSEVENLGVAALGDEHVRRLDVAVNDSLRVGGIERVGNFDGQREQQSRFPAACPRCGASASRRPETPWR